MSIVTLKKKTQTQYNNMSVNSNHGFSLNGTRRSQGYVGQTSLSRSHSRTLMRGGAQRGYGGCCGYFINFPIISSSVTSLNDPNIVKPSVINTKGLFEEKYNHFLNNQVVKPDGNQHLNTQYNRITNLAKNTILCANALKATDASLNEYACNKCYNYNPFYRRHIRTFTKPTSNYVPISQGEYLLKLNLECAKLDPPFVPSANSNGALPGPPASY
jgi:hypothetical protein